MTLFSTLISDMGKHAQAEYPRECCGLITKDFKYVACENISPFPKDSFVVVLVVVVVVVVVLIVKEYND